MVRVDKCPNCGAFLPARRPGLVRKCEFCGMEAGGFTQTIDVKAASVEDAVRQRLAELRAQRGTPMLAPPRLDEPVPSKLPQVVFSSVVFAAMLGVGGWAYWQSQKVTQRAEAIVAAAEAPAKEAAAAALEDAAAAGGFSRLDGLAYLDRLQPRATTLAPDLQLTSLTLNLVRPDGFADLTLDRDQGINIDWRSPLRSSTPAGAVKGVKLELECVLYHAMRYGAAPTPLKLYPRDAQSCDAPLVQRPTCTVAAIWQRALDKGAPADAVASLRYAAVDDKTPDVPTRGRWTVSIELGAKDFSASFIDDCDQPATPPAAPEGKPAKRRGR